MAMEHLKDQLYDPNEDLLYLVSDGITKPPPWHACKCALTLESCTKATAMACLQVSKDPLKVAVEHLKDQPYDPAEDVIKATSMELVSTLKELLTLHPLYNEQLKSFASFGADFQDMSRLSDLAASLTSAQEGPLQEVLEQLNVPERCAFASAASPLMLG